MNPYLQLIQSTTLPDTAKVLDIGAGGFGGANTVANLIKKFYPENITLIENNEMFFNKLQVYPNCKKILADFFTYKFEQKFDLISIDLDSILQFGKFQEILNLASELLTADGYIIFYEINNIDFIKTGNLKDEAITRNHIVETYGTDKIITTAHFKQYFTKDFEVIGNIARTDLLQWVLIKKINLSTPKETNIEATKPILTIAIPSFNSKDIAWLAMESLCRQKDIDFDWEIIIMEEQNDTAFLSENFLKYKKRLSKIRCQNIQYIPLENRITLSEKWRRLGALAHKGSIGFLLQACDCYSYPTRLKMSFYAFMAGFDWVQCHQGYFYEIQTGKIIKYNGNSIQWAKNHLNMGFKTFYARQIPFAEIAAGIDGWLFNTFQKIKVAELSVYNDTLDNWKLGIDTHGHNNISKNRVKFFADTKPPFEPTDITIEEILPIDIIQRLEKLKK